MKMAAWTRMKSLSMLLLLMTITTTTTTADGIELSYSEQETALRKELFADYNPDSYPSNSTTLTLDNYRLINFNMNEAQHMIELDGWFSWQWKDPRLAWNTTKYNKISVLRVPTHKVWTADILIYSGADWINLDHIGEVLSLIYPDGSMLHVPPGHLKSACIADLTHWPHDVHNCTVKLGSWVADGILINVTIRQEEFELEEFQTSPTSDVTRSEWNLLSSKISRNVKFYTCCEEPYIDIKFEMVIQRNAPALAYTFKLPAVGLGILCLFVFLLPPAAGEKLLLSCLLLLMDLQFLIHTSDAVQYSPTHIPIVVRIVSEQLILVLLSVIVSVIAMRMTQPPHGEQLSSIIMNPLRALAPFLLLGKYSKMSETYHAVHGKDEVELGDTMAVPLNASRVQKDHGDWILIAAVVDRVLFLIYFIVIIASFVKYPSIQ